MDKPLVRLEDTIQIILDVLKILDARNHIKQYSFDYIKDAVYKGIKYKENTVDCVSILFRITWEEGF